MLVKLMRFEMRRLVRRFQLRVFGHIPYFGSRLWLARDSFVARSIVNETIYEAPVYLAMRDLAIADTTVFDIGANVGATVLPLLAERADIHVVSFECSPNVLGYLRRTHEDCAHRGRWKIMDFALGSADGVQEFFVTEGQGGVLDGFRDTGRSAAGSKVEVQVRTLDGIWKTLGRPPVSVIKIDVEGAESEVLAGAVELLETQRPMVLLEWARSNLAAYGIEPKQLFGFRRFGYEIHALPDMQRVDAALLPLFMGRTAMFALVPKQSSASQ